MFDLLVKNANLQDGRSRIDVACSKGRIVAVEPNVIGQAREVIDATGRLVIPPFVDAHWHLDGALLHGNPYSNESGTLYEGIEIWSKLKNTASVEDYKERARRVLCWAIANGSLHIRCQTDICDPQLRAVQALIEVRDELRPYIDLQLVAFPQDGYLRDPNGIKLMKRALDMGMDAVGGIPDYELTAPLGYEAVRQLCELADKRGLLVDMHIDQTTDPQSRQIEAIAQECIRLKMGARISASHCPSMANYDDYYADKLIAQLARLPQSGLPNPDLLDQLTAREREVVALVAHGFTNEQIAGRLVVSPATAKTHVSRAMVKLRALSLLSRDHFASANDGETRWPNSNCLDGIGCLQHDQVGVIPLRNAIPIET